MSRRLVSNIFNLILAILIVPIGWISYVEINKLAGLRPTPVEVAGTGSMYPSLYWDESQGGPEKSGVTGIEEYRSSPRMYRFFEGIRVAGRVYLKSEITYGDMIAFSSDQTREILIKEGKPSNLGFIKRVIALPGDTVELRDGFVVRNSQVVDEPYVRSPRSTYGGDTIPECKVVTVPSDSYFVLGDNRRVSSDSRFELGFVKREDIQFLLPLTKQSNYTPLWRDTSQDKSLMGTPTLLVADFYLKLSNLRRSATLERSANIRGNALLNSRSTKTDLAASTKQAGYENKATGEFVLYGSATVDELLESLMGSYDTRAQLTNPDYQDIGLAVVTGEVDGCPTQVIVGHLGGYVPATYDQSTLDSWKSARDNLDRVIPSWEAAVGREGVDQVKLKELLTILYNRRDLASEVITAISNREWMSEELISRVEADGQNSKRADELASDLNGE